MNWAKRLRGKVSQLKKDTAKKKQYLKYYRSAKPGSRMTYGQWLKTPKIKTAATKKVEQQLKKQGGLTEKEIRRFQPRKK